MKLKVLAVAPLLLLIGCQAAENLRARVTRRVQSVAICSLVQITATGGSAMREVQSEPATPLQLKSRAPEQRPRIAKPAANRKAISETASAVPAELKRTPAEAIETAEVETAEVETPEVLIAMDVAPAVPDLRRTREIVRQREGIRPELARVKVLRVTVPSSPSRCPSQAAPTLAAPEARPRVAGSGCTAIDSRLCGEAAPLP